MVELKVIMKKWNHGWKETSVKCYSYWKINNQVRNSRNVMMMSLFLTKHHAMKTYCRSGGIAPRNL